MSSSENLEILKDSPVISRLSRGKRKDDILKATKKAGMNPDASMWLLSALDPFHDSEISLRGFPDGASGRSVIMQYNQSMTIKKPTGLGATATFDAHIAFLPYSNRDIRGDGMQVYTEALSSYRNQYICDPGTAGTVYNSSTFGGLICNTVAEGVTTFEEGHDYLTNNFGYKVLDPSAIVPFDGTAGYRVIGGAFEVYNSTPELYRSGTVTTYTVPSPKSLCHVGIDGEVGSAGKMWDRIPHYVHPGPPCTLAHAKFIGGRSWSAAEGCMVPIRLNQGPRDAEVPGTLPHGCQTKPEGFGGLNHYLLPLTFNQISPRRSTTHPYTPDNGAYNQTNCIMSYDFGTAISGAYFTGLNAQSTLNVNLKCFVEVFVEPDSPFATLANTPTPKDLQALEAYFRVMNEILSGYPVSENALGEFFKRVLRALQVAAVPARAVTAQLQNLPGPYGKVFSVANQGLQLIPAPKKKKKATVKK